LTAEHARVAVVIPCLNEGGTIAKVVRDFKASLPGASIYVYDNGSTDDTPAVAREAGALVRTEAKQGKGNVVRRMFADIEADVYVMVDGDDTYDASVAPSMVGTLISENLDMVVAARTGVAVEAYRRGHRLGNRLFAGLHGLLYGSRFVDVFSGYRAMSRRFVKSFPTTSSGFEIEAELTAHALDVWAPSAEINAEYRSRDAESESKLRTYRDGLRILLRSVLYYKELQPGRFFGVVFLCFALAGALAGVPVIQQYADTGEVLRIPLAILAASLEVLAFICLIAGVILDSIARRHRELKRLSYLQHTAPAALAPPEVDADLIEDHIGEPARPAATVAHASGPRLPRV
jgi:glycosyltransferase involved in cell wall biosynthesis